MGMLLLLPPLAALTPGPELETAVIQFEISRDMVRSREAYAAAVIRGVEQALEAGPADLLIFPEYTSVFASLIPWQGYLEEEAPFEQVWGEIARDNPGLTGLTDLFLRESGDTDRFLDNLWGPLAEQHRVYILSGTRFRAGPSGRRLTNQAVVYGPEGTVVYRQNKYFLTEFEEEILGLSPGDLSDTGGFTVKEYLIRLTICRDTFLKQWESLYREGSLWIDIKANGVEYTPDQEELFTRALPARLPRTPIPYGITACLTGDFLNLLWQGESSILYNNYTGSVMYTEVADTSDRFEILRESFPVDGSFRER